MVRYLGTSEGGNTFSESATLSGGVTVTYAENCSTHDYSFSFEGLKPMAAAMSDELLTAALRLLLATPEKSGANKRLPLETGIKKAQLINAKKFSRSMILPCGNTFSCVVELKGPTTLVLWVKYSG